MTENKVEILWSTIHMADRQRERLSSAMDLFTPLMPLTGETLEKLQFPEISYLDTFVMRFSKLQDIMGAKLFGMVLEHAEEQVPPSFLDRLNMLEKLGVIPDAHHWLELRRIRNALSHEYPDDTGKLAETLNEAFGEVPYLFLCFEELKAFAQGAQKKKTL